MRPPPPAPPPCEGEGSGFLRFPAPSQGGGGALVHINPLAPEPEIIARAAAILQRGGLVAFPTETVYGLGADALNEAAVRGIFAAKRRALDDPLIVHLASMDDLPTIVTDLPPIARALAERFWPGPLTLVLPKRPIVPDVATAGLPTVAVRIPSHPVAQALIRAAGRPIAAPSANLFTRASATTAVFAYTRTRAERLCSLAPSGWRRAPMQRCTARSGPEGPVT